MKFLRDVPPSREADRSRSTEWRECEYDGIVYCKRHFLSRLSRARFCLGDRGTSARHISLRCANSASARLISAGTKEFENGWRHSDVFHRRLAATRESSPADDHRRALRTHVAAGGLHPGTETSRLPGKNKPKSRWIATTPALRCCTSMCAIPRPATSPRTSRNTPIRSGDCAKPCRRWSFRSADQSRSRRTRARKRNSRATTLGTNWPRSIPSRIRSR